MFFVFKQTWTAGADPSEQPDTVRLVAVHLSLEGAQARAAAIAAVGRDARQDPRTGSWWMRTSDALHELLVRESLTKRS